MEIHVTFFTGSVEKSRNSRAKRDELNYSALFPVDLEELKVVTGEWDLRPSLKLTREFSFKMMPKLTKISIGLEENKKVPCSSFKMFRPFESPR